MHAIIVDKKRWDELWESFRAQLEVYRVTASGKITPLQGDPFCDYARKANYELCSLKGRLESAAGS